jgi:hypothetical protein
VDDNSEDKNDNLPQTSDIEGVEEDANDKHQEDTLEHQKYVEMLSLLRTDPEVYDDKKQKHSKRFHSKVVTKIELS